MLLSCGPLFLILPFVSYYYNNTNGILVNTFAFFTSILYWSKLYPEIYKFKLLTLDRLAVFISILYYSTILESVYSIFSISLLLLFYYISFVYQKGYHCMVHIIAFLTIICAEKINFEYKKKIFEENLNSNINISNGN